MTEEEKELEQKIKQYQYEEAENRKKLEALSNDMHKGKKKTFILKMNKFIFGILLGTAILGFVIYGCLLLWAINNFFR